MTDGLVLGLRMPGYLGQGGSVNRKQEEGQPGEFQAQGRRGVKSYWRLLLTELSVLFFICASLFLTPNSKNNEIHTV